MAGSKKNDGEGFHPEIALWEPKNGKNCGVYVTPAVYDTLQKAEVGSKITLMETTEEFRQTVLNKGKVPPAYKLIIFPPNQQENRQGQASTTKSKGKPAAQDAQEV